MTTPKWSRRLQSPVECDRASKHSLRTPEPGVVLRLRKQEDGTRCSAGISSGVPTGLRTQPRPVIPPELLLTYPPSDCHLRLWASGRRQGPPTGPAVNPGRPTPTTGTPRPRPLSGFGCECDTVLGGRCGAKGSRLGAQELTGKLFYFLKGNEREGPPSPGL